jgi:glycosyltransferase involved in cell wall biosynthesis
MLFFLPNLELAAFSSQLPIVQTIHDLSFWRFPEFFSRRAQLWHKMVRVPHSLKRAKRLIVDSQHTAAELLAYDQSLRDKITIVPLASDPQLTDLISLENFKILQTKYNLPEKYIFGLGALEPRKNWESLFLAWQKLRAAQQISAGLVIAGGAVAQ